MIPENVPVQRWTAKKRSALLILSILNRETTPQEAARKHDLTVAEVEEWREKFLGAGENAVRSRLKDEEGLKDQQIKRLKQKVGKRVMDLGILREAVMDRPFEERTPDE